MAEIPTPRQLQVLGVVHQLTVQLGRPPGVRELGRALEISSTNGVNDHLKALRRKGLLEDLPGQIHGIQLSADGRAAIGAPCCSCSSCECGCHAGAAADPRHVSEIRLAGDGPAARAWGALQRGGRS